MKLYTTVIKINSNDIIKFVKINLINKFLYPLSIIILTALIFTVLGLLPNLLHYTIFYISVNKSYQIETKDIMSLLLCI